VEADFELITLSWSIRTFRLAAVLGRRKQK
jgi:hypothetical protein